MVKPRFVWVSDIEGGGVAKANLDTGVIYLSKAEMKHLPKSWQDWIRAHEEGHVVLQTMDELEADCYAFYKWVHLGHNLSDSLFALSRVLEIDQIPAHSQRFDTHVQRVRMYDFLINKNTTLADQLGIQL